MHGGTAISPRLIGAYFLCGTKVGKGKRRLFQARMRVTRESWIETACASPAAAVGTN